ncbi:unnamed protein product [Caenorhabditis auriculariae]|uniref:sphingomyelin phosphodiesterase n=1 Tax=Caenorhabditis auriculariae TaxID=2777116 RepID=A0A8S1GQB7_9PELO|nr:unnamed protein product [Caenorhabditis auriculariae]
MSVQEVQAYHDRRASSAERIVRKNTGAITQLRVLTLNMWCLPQPWPIGSSDRTFRLERLSEALIRERYDIVGLQELWSEKDFLRLADRIEKEYPFRHYFHSGFTGSGVCVFSRHPIVSTLTHRYSLNGFAHHIHRGDWFGGKVVGLAEVEIGDLRVNFYTTHLHAEYDRENDLYLPHRTAQSLELSQFVRHTSRGSDVVIVTGDFNMEPQDLGLRLILAQVKLCDAWRMCHEKESCSETGDALSLSECRGVVQGGTCDRPDNCYTRRSLRNKDESKRIDYVLFKSERANVKIEECEIAMNQIPCEEKNYSDHVALEARFTIQDDARQQSLSWESNRPLLIEAIGIVSGGQRRARSDRILFFIGTAACLLLILVSFFVSVFPFAFAFLRFALTVLAVFFVYQGLIGLTLERKALKAAKHEKADINVVTYSRFGLPGDEIDDRPPPTQIYVASFDDNAPEFKAFGSHSTRAALISAGVGISMTLFFFLSVFFEFDWYHHRKGVDVGALTGLVLFLGLGLLVHSQVLKGIKKNNGAHLVPFIICYATFLCLESLMILFLMGHFMSAPHSIDTRPATIYFIGLIMASIMFVQAAMLHSVTRCRNYLEKRSIFDAEMRVAEMSKSQNPAMKIVYIGPSERVDSHQAANSTPPIRTILASGDSLA